MVAVKGVREQARYSALYGARGAGTNRYCGTVSPALCPMAVWDRRDADRDNMGRVTEARCSEGFWLSIILIPLLLLGVILCFLCLPDSVCGIVCGCFKRMKYHPV
eukprot:3045795-Rhodomonas_salina.1